MAVKIACQASDFIRNTGSNSSLLPEAPVMILVVDKSLRFTIADLGDDPVAFFLEQYHALGKSKVFPLFGNAAPVDYLANNDTQDVTITTDSGKPVFVRYGFMVKNFGSLEGGMCLAKAMKSMNNLSMGFIEIASSGRMLVAQFDETHFGGIPGFAFAPKPGSADFANPARNNFQISYDTPTFIDKAKILEDDNDAFSALLDTMGLIDLSMTINGAAASSTTTLEFRVIDKCCGDDATSELPAEFLDPSNFIVTKDSDGSVKTITGVTLSGEDVVLTAATATFVSGDKYNVNVVDTSALFDNGVEGYDIPDQLQITIP